MQRDLRRQIGRGLHQDGRVYDDCGGQLRAPNYFDRPHQELAASEDHVRDQLHHGKHLCGSVCQHSRATAA